jgi:hypothetical protein
MNNESSKLFTLTITMNRQTRYFGSNHKVGILLYRL